MAVLGQAVVGLIFVSAVIYLTVTLAHAAILPTTGYAQDEIVGKRAAFHAWAGKRSVSSTSRLRAETVPQSFISHRPIGHRHGTPSSKHTGDHSSSRNGVVEDTVDHSSIGNVWRRPHLGDNSEPQETGVETETGHIEQDREVEEEHKTMNVAALNDTDAGDSLKRAAFSSWAGKRAPFNSWAGKRAPFSSWAGKRAPFSSWAGKRGNLVNVYDTRGDTSTTYQVWLDRGSNGDNVYPAQVPVSRAWRHAQHPHHAENGMLVNPELSGDDGRTGSAGTVKRIAFLSWAGNREFQPKITRNSWQKYLTELFVNEASVQKQQKIKELVARKALNAWASKRAPFSAWAGKRSGEVNIGHWLDKPRQADYSLERDDYSLTQVMPGQDEESAVHNKDRSGQDENRSGQDENRSGQYKGRSIHDGARKRAAFSAWAGKRSTHRRTAWTAWTARPEHSRTAFTARPEHSRTAFTARPEHSRTAFTARPDKLSNPSWQSNKGDMSAPLHRATKRPRLEAPRRSYHLLHKRAAFNAKGGKRTAVNSREVYTWPWNHNRWSGKRAPFNAWGGKRSTTFLSPQDDVKAEELLPIVDLTRRAPFSAWGGKRSFPARMTRPERRAGFHVWAGKRGEPQDSYAVSIYGDRGGPEDGYSNPTSGDKRSPEDDYSNPTSDDKESSEDDYSAPTSGDHGVAEEGYTGPTAQGEADRDLHDVSSQDKQRTLPIASSFPNNMVVGDAPSNHAFSSLSSQIVPVPLRPYRNLAKVLPQVVQVQTPHLVFISSSSRNGRSHIGLGASTCVGFRKDISGLPAEVPGYSQHEDEGGYSQHEDERDMDLHSVRSWPLLTYLALTPDSGLVKRRFNSWAGRR